MSDTAYTTARLLARRWRDDDLAPLLQVYGDAEAMRWVGEGLAITPEQCRQWLQVTYDNYRLRGYGMFALEQRDGSGVVGFCGLVHPGGQPEAEVKYAFRRACWGLGYATEAVIGLLDYGAAQHGLRELIATTAPENVASHRVLIKAGMERAELRRNEDGSETQLFVWRTRQE